MENTYEKISGSDFDLFGNLIHQARGRVALNKFAVQCGSTARTFAAYTRKGERSACSSEKALRKLVDPIVENADANSGITEEKMFASMGFLSKEYIIAAYRYYQKQLYNGKQSSGYDFQSLFDSISNEMSKKEMDNVAFIEFLDDISFFGSTLSNEEAYEIRKRLYKIYNQKTLVKQLHKFHTALSELSVNDRNNVFRYLRYTQTKKIPVGKYEGIKKLHSVLVDLLIDF